MRAAAAGGGASWKSISLRVMSGEHHCEGLNAERREKATVAKNELQEMSCTCWLYRQAVWSLHQPDSAGLRGTQRPPATRAIAQLLTDFAMTSMHVLERRVVADDAAPAATMATNTIASVLMLIESLRVAVLSKKSRFCCRLCHSARERIWKSKALGWSSSESTPKLSSIGRLECLGTATHHGAGHHNRNACELAVCGHCAATCHMSLSVSLTATGILCMSMHVNDS